MAVTLSTLGASVSGNGASLSGRITWGIGDNTVLTGVRFRVYHGPTDSYYYTSSQTYSNPNPGAPFEVVDNVSGSISGLLYNATYSYRLIWSGGEAGNSNSFTTGKEPQSAPSAPSLASRTATSITLVSVAGCEYRRGSGAWQSSTTFSGLIPETTYAFYQRYAETATKAASPSSAQSNFTTLAETITPSAPSNINVSVSGLDVTITFTKGTNATGTQRLFLGNTTSTTGTSFNFTVANYNTNYAASLRSYNTTYGTYSDWVDVYFSTGPAPSPPPTPTGLSATNGNNSVSLSWNSSSGATEYLVYRDGANIATVFSTSYSDTGASAPSISASMSASTNSATQINVSISASTNNGTLHTYTVRAGNVNGYSGHSSSTTGRRVPGTLSYQIRAGNSSSTGTHTLVANDSTYIDTSNPPSGSAPSSVTVDNATANSLRVSWSGAQAFNGSTRYYSSTVTAAGCANQSPTANGYRLGQISGYEVFRSTTSGVLGSSIGSSSSPKTDTGLTANTDYFYTVRTFISGIATTYDSSQATGKTLSARPENFSWSVAKTSGQNFVVTASEWNAFTARINLFRIYKSLSTTSFTTAVTGNNFSATIFNQVRSAIADMSPPTPPPSVVSSGADVYASQLNGLVSSLNSIV